MNMVDMHSRPPRISGTSVCLQEMHCIWVGTESCWDRDNFRRFEDWEDKLMPLSGVLDAEESAFRDVVVRFVRVVPTGPDFRVFRLNVGATSCPGCIRTV